jgi:regulation of enolase protein 1 (concanavalin A-like superfamily)
VLVAGVLWLLIATHRAAGQVTSLGPEWSHGDIGDPAIAGDAESSGDTLIVRGAGNDVWGQSDQFHFVYRAISGDTDITVRVADLQDVHTWTKAGVMIRESLRADASHAFMLVTPSQGLAFQWRAQTGGNTSHTAGAGVAAPVWVRLVRAGTVVRAYSSATGDAWTLVATATIDMQPDAYVGLAVTTHDPGQTATATFSNLTVRASTTTPPALPFPWIATDVGYPALTGRTDESGGTFTVVGSGEDIWNESDQFQFVYQPMTGDIEVVALVATLQGADEWSKAGVMIRAGLTGPEAHAFMLATGANGWAFQRRLVTGGSSDHTAGGGGTAPGWVRLVRVGDVSPGRLPANDAKNIVQMRGSIGHTDEGIHRCSHTYATWSPPDGRSARSWP